MTNGLSAGLPRLAELQNELIRVALDGLVKYLDRARISGIREKLAVAVEDKARGFDFATYRGRIDTV